jgi:hypothetical protein
MNTTGTLSSISSNNFSRSFWVSFVPTLRKHELLDYIPLLHVVRRISGEHATDAAPCVGQDPLSTNSMVYKQFARATGRRSRKQIAEK